jgi:hypothetical protein
MDTPLRRKVMRKRKEEKHEQQQVWGRGGVGKAYIHPCICEIGARRGK